MSFKVSRKVYSTSEQDPGDIYPAIRKEVMQYLRENGTRYATPLFWLKAFLLISGALLFYILMLQANQPATFVIAYISFSWLLLMTGFNIAHDAAHGCLTGKKKTDNILFEVSFCLLGANPYLWKIRHLHSHHPYPNVEGCDADIELTPLLRFDEEQTLRKVHSRQYFYAPFLYCIYTLYWIFYKDMVLFLRKKQANICFTNHPLWEWIKLFSFKLIYLVIFIIIPIIIHPGFGWVCFLAFLLSHFINSLFLLFTFLISHHVPQTHKQVKDHRTNAIPNSWLMQQVTSSADFHAEEKWAYWLFGGFNAHVAHHLFPGICHVHYPHITSIIRRHLSASHIPYHSFTWWQGVKYHMRLLKQMGKTIGNRQLAKCILFYIVLPIVNCLLSLSHYLV